MKTWSVGPPNPRGDLYTDETPVPKPTEEERALAVRRVMRLAEPGLVDEVLEMLGLTDASQ